MEAELDQIIRRLGELRAQDPGRFAQSRALRSFLHEPHVMRIVANDESEDTDSGRDGSLFKAEADNDESEDTDSGRDGSLFKAEADNDESEDTDGGRDGSLFKAEADNAVETRRGRGSRSFEDAHLSPYLCKNCVQALNSWSMEFSREAPIPELFRDDLSWEEGSIYEEGFDDEDGDKTSDSSSDSSESSSDSSEILCETEGMFFNRTLSRCSICTAVLENYRDTTTADHIRLEAENHWKLRYKKNDRMELVISARPRTQLLDKTFHLVAIPESQEDKSVSNTKPASEWTIAEEWLQKCELHSRCNSSDASSFLPDRLVDIGTFDCQISKLQLKSDVAPGAKYLTLSHRWGTDPSSMPGRLLKDNLVDFLVNIPTSCLTKTFQDAMDVARAVGVQYVWIDSLCIVQDSKEDWQEQSALMGTVYANGYFNIAAISPLAGQEGLHLDARKVHVTPTVQMNLGHKGKAAAYSFLDQDMWTNQVENSPLFTRGWVLQERLLSKRNLLFGKRQALWECWQSARSQNYHSDLVAGAGQRSLPSIKNTKAEISDAWFPSKYASSDCSTSEDLDNDLPILETAEDEWYDESDSVSNSGFYRQSSARELDLWSVLNLPLSRIQRRSSDVFLIWSDLIEAYTKCDLTWHSDILVAISGLASRFQQKIGGKYLAGLWEMNLLEDLLWEQCGERHHTGRSEQPASDKSGYIAPSWSWACTKKLVRRSYLNSEAGDTRSIRSDSVFEYGEHLFPHTVLYCGVSEAHIDLKTNDPFGQVNGGHLLLTGKLVKAEFSDSRWARLRPYLTLPSHKNRRKEIKIKPQWDNPEHVGHIQDLFLLLIRTQIQEMDEHNPYCCICCSGLILRAVPDQPRCFSRVGMFKWPNNELENSFVSSSLDLEIEARKIDYFFQAFMHGWSTFDTTPFAETLDQSVGIEGEVIEEFEEHDMTKWMTCMTMPWIFEGTPDSSTYIIKII